MRTNLQHREREPDRRTTARATSARRRSEKLSFRRPKRVLIVSSHFPPERAAGVHRILRTISQLRGSNWPVSVLTVDPDYYKAGTPIDVALEDRLPDARAKRVERLLAQWC